MWDGAEQANLSGQECSENGFESHSAVMGWSISPQLYSKWKTNVENKFGKKFFIAPEYNRAWNYGNYKNSGLMRLQATAVHGLTIFWQQRSPKNSANE
jgi:hypothetical protein